MMSYRRSAVVGLAWIATAALAVPVGSTAIHAQRSDTTVIRVGAPVNPGVATLVEELTLGNGIDTDEYRFTNAFVYGGANGMVYVVDTRDPTNVGDFRTDVRQYDRTGKFVRTFGRIGQGPGEYTGRITDVRELPDGRVLLSDAQGLLVYSAGGEPLARWKARAMYPNDGGSILVDPAGFVSVYGRIPGDTLPYFHRFRFDGTPVDTSLAPDAIFPRPPRVGRAALPFTGAYRVAWSPLGYFATTMTSSYAIDLRMPPTFATSGRPASWKPGDPVRSIRNTIAAVRVQDAERDDWRQSITMFNRNGPGQWPAWKWSGPEIPTVRSPLRNLPVDMDGRLWVQLSQPGQLDRSVAVPTIPKEATTADARRRWPEPLVFDVLEPSGRNVGRVRFPDGVGTSALGTKDAFTVRGDTVWAVSVDKDDVPLVRRYRIRWGR